ncbi:uncharacterized protein LOC129039973 isoform X4 [Pongo pygmaeus]|uniref:uncharacterized protein LOC129039973 isoform X4 n=1 Tax=Pongo pygmaeus TaxID=9600 RepID=UPI00300C31E2
MSPYFIPILYSRKQEFVDICKSLCFGVSHSSACSVLSNLFYVANACSFLIAQPIYCLLQEAFLNPPVSKVYMDIKIGNKPAGCIQTLVRSDVVPMTAENFCYLCTHLKDLASREAASTALSPSSRARAVISQTTAAPGASPSTRRNLMMKTLSSNTQDQVCAGMALSVPWHIWPSWRPQKGRTSTLFYRGRNGHSRLPQTPRHQKPGDPEKTQTAKRETGGKAKRLRATPSRRFLPAVRHRFTSDLQVVIVI